VHAWRCCDSLAQIAADSAGASPARSNLSPMPSLVLDRAEFHAASRARRATKLSLTCVTFEQPQVAKRG